MTLSVRNLRCSYGDFVAVDDVSFEIAAGRVLGLLGPNGAGKSTTVKSIVGLKRPDGGSIQVGGIELATDPVGAKKLLGYVPEVPALYEPLTPFEHLQLFGRLHSLDDATIATRIESLLGLLGLSDVRSVPIGTFSKGMRQKVLLASALLHDPQVVILDEPLSGLDAETTGLVKELLHEMTRRGKSVLYTSHILDVVERVCDEMVVLHRGRVVASGDLEELRSKAGANADLDEVFRILTAAEDPSIRARSMLDAVSK